MNSFKAGIIQFDVKLNDSDYNLNRAIEGINSLEAIGADIAVLPEMWSCGFDNTRLDLHALKTPYILDKLSKKASECKIIIVGSLPESSGKDIFNTSYVIEKDGSFAGSYRKIHLFSLTEEDRYYQAGNKAVICETSVGTIGLSICYDLRFPELGRALTLKGARVIIVSAQWPLERIRHWNILLRARAIENQIFIIAANRCGKDNVTEYGGSSRIIAPGGKILSRAGKEESILHAGIDLNEIDDLRALIPCLHERVPDAYII